MNGKRRVSLNSLLLVGVLLSVAGCGSSPPPVATPAQPSDTALPPTEVSVPLTVTPVPLASTPVPTHAPAPRLPALVNYRQESWGIQIDRPVDWSVEAGPEQVLLSKQEDLTLLLISVYTEEIPVSPEALLGLSTGFMGEDVEIDLGQVATRMLGNQEAAVAPLAMTTDDVPLQGTLALVTSQDTGYTFMLLAMTLAALWDAKAPIFEAMYDSIEFFPPSESLVLPTKEKVIEEGQLELVHVSHFEDPGGSLRFVGEVQNHSETGVEEVEVLVQLLDGDENPITDEAWSIPMNLIPPGDRSPFEVVFLDPPAIWEKYQVRASADPADFMLDYTYSELEIREHAGTTLQGGEFEVTGSVKNVGEIPAEFVQVTLAVYDAVGDVIAVDYTFVAADVLAPGDESPFSMILLSMGGEAATYRLLAQGAKAD